jgi:hypothetical protein
MRNEKIMEPSQWSKIWALDSLNGTHIATEWITEDENHVHRPRQFNWWCLNGVWLCALLQILIYTMSEPVRKGREMQLSKGKQLRDKRRDQYTYTQAIEKEIEWKIEWVQERRKGNW